VWVVEDLVGDKALTIGRFPWVSTHDRGRHELRGIPGDWHLYAVER